MSFPGGEVANGPDCGALVCRGKMRVCQAAQPTAEVFGGYYRTGLDVKPDPLQSQRCARKLAALAAPERLRIVHFLRDGPKNVGEIAEMLQTAAVNVSHHMHVLVEAGLVDRQKRGRFVFYSLLPGVLQTEDESHDHLDLGCCRLELPPDDEQGDSNTEHL